MLDAADPYNYVELRGAATITEDVGRKVDNELSWNYDGKDVDPDPPGTVRLVVNDDRTPSKRDDGRDAATS